MAVTAFNYSIQEAEAGGSLLSSKHNELKKKTYLQRKTKNKTNPKRFNTLFYHST